VSISNEPATHLDRTEIPEAEYRDRARRLAVEVSARGLDAVVVWSKGGGTMDRYADVLYLTNHSSQFPHIQDVSPHWAGRAHSAVLVTSEGETVLFSDIADWRRDLVVADRVVVTLDLPKGIAEEVDARRLRHSRLGLIASESMVMGTWRRLQSWLPGVEWVHVDDVLERMRAIKSKSEISVIRKAVEVGDLVMGAMLEACVAGATEADVAAAGWSAAIRAGAAPYDLPGASGPHANNFSYGSLPSWSMRTLENGDLYHSDMYGAYHGYYFDYTRSTVVGGDPSPEQLAVMEGAIGVVEAVIDAIRPGVTFDQVYARGAEFLAKNGFDAGSSDDVVAGLGLAFPSFGHSLGLAWESPWIVPGNHAICEPNMYLAIEAAVGATGVGSAGFEQDILISSDGCEILPRLTPRWWER
jgi:Xaa-Pro aminopeptidase